MEAISTPNPGVAATRADLLWLKAVEYPRTAASLRDSLREQVPGLVPASLHRLAIVGAAPEGRRLASICEARGIEIVAITDDDPAKAGIVVSGTTVAPVSALETFDRSIPVIIASHRVLGSTERLRALGFSCVWPFALLQVLAPEAFPPHMFYQDWLEDLAQNRAHYLALAARLADDRSRQVLDAVLGFRLTLDPLCLKPVVEGDLYAPRGVLSFSDDEVYVDGGSFDGDSVRSFIDHVGNRFARIYAFEPDPQTYGRLCANFTHEPRVQPIPAGLYSRKGTLRFRNDSTRGAIFSEDGEIEMAVTAIDDVIGNDRVSYVKMNIEGAEIDALRGAARSVKRCRPKLAISAYHRPSDLWRVPETVRELDVGYDLYLRQHDGGVIETVLYARPRR